MPARSSLQTVTLIEGDGIGPEIARAVVEVFSACEAPVTWEPAEAGLACIEKHGSGLPQETLDSIIKNGVALKGPTTTPSAGGHKSVNVSIRKLLGLYANVRPCRSLPSISTRFENVDLVIVRENVEDTYGGIEHVQTPDVVQGLKLITRPGSLAVNRYAFEMARREGRKKVTCVHKANIHKLTDGLFLECFQQVACDYPDIESNDILIDNCCMQLVTRPDQFDVLVTMNLFGDILSDLCAGLIGGLGVAPGGNIGVDRAVFEAVHGSAPDIAGQGLANPTALLLSSVQMLRYMGLYSHAARIEQGIRLALVERVHTGDLGGNASTEEFTRAVINAMPAPDQIELPQREAVHTRRAGESDTGLVTVDLQEWDVMGADVFIRCDQGMPKVPENVGPLSLRMISNRGTKILPPPTPDITLVDSYRCRYRAEAPINDDDIHALLRELAKSYEWVHVEKLHEVSGMPQYSKAQGE